MTVTAWRVVDRRYTVSPYNPFDGEGARKFGGRWNSPGVPMVYLSAARSLAILERLVHAKSLSALVDCVIFRIRFSESLVTQLDLSALPADWADPAVPGAVRSFGDRWVKDAPTPILRVPSAVVQGEDNYAFNPLHPDVNKLEIGSAEPLPIDPRLLLLPTS